VSVIDSDEARFNEALADLHELCDWARDIRDACELGELDLSEEEGRELVATIRDKVESCERWRTALRFRPIPIPDNPRRGSRLGRFRFWVGDRRCTALKDVVVPEPPARDRWGAPIKQGLFR
jgi:hypothetical protein